MEGCAQLCGPRSLARRFAQLALPILLVGPTLSAAAPSEIAAEPSKCPAPAWTGIASPNPGGVANQLSALSAVSRSRAWAVGSSVEASGATVPLVAAWNGAAWAGSTPAGAAAGTSQLHGVTAISPTDAVAVGTTEQPDGSELALVLRWNGTGWSAANPSAGPGGHRLLAVAAVSASDVVAVGSTVGADGTSPLVLRWNGAVWTAAHPDAGSGDHELTGVTAISSSDIVAVGTTTDDGQKKALVLRWNGTDWSATNPDFGPGDHELRAVDAVTATDVVAVGASTTEAGTTPLVLRWDGTEWAAAAPGPSGGVLNAVSASSGDDVWAVGQTSAPAATLSLHWDGATWAAVETPAGTSLNGVAALAPGDAWAAGATASGTLISHYGPCPTIRGAVRNGAAGVGGVTVQLAGDATASTSSAADGTYAFAGLAAGGDYTVTAARDGYAIAPSTRSVAGLVYDREDVDFTATPLAPGATTGAASGVGLTSATLNGTVTPNGWATTYRFEYGPTAAYGSSTPAASAGNGQSPVSVSANVAGLAADTTYHYRLVATSAAGTGTGQDRTFTTGRPSLALSPPSVTVTEGDSGTASITFTVALSAASGNTVRVDYASANGTALAGQDYTATAGTLIYNPGQTSKQINVSVLGDHLDESNETLTLGLTNPANAAISAGAATITIADDDTAPTATTLAASSVTETAATLNGQANPNGKQTSVRFDYGATTNYGSQTTTQVIAAGTSPVAVNAPLTNLAADTTYHYRLVATSAAGTGAGQDRTFTTGFPSVTVTPTTPSVSEPDTGDTPTSFTVRLSSASSETVTVQYATDAETASAGEDFTTASGTLTFTAGQTAKNVAVAVRGDVLDEDDETFLLRLTGATRATIATASARKTILDNDPLPALGVADPIAVSEGSGSGTTTVTFTVALVPLSGRTASVQYATQNGTATAPGDFTAASGTLTFAKGETTKQVQVVVVRDVLDEADETFTLVLSNPTNATIGDGSATAAIRDDDEPPALWIESAGMPEGNSGSQVLQFSIRLCPPGTGAAGCAADAAVPSALQVSATFTSADGTASAPSDYTAATGALTVPPGAKSATIGITVKGDLSFERDEDFTLTLSAPANATLARATATGTIRNDDQPPEVSISDATVVEGGLAKFDLTLCVPGSSSTSAGCTPLAAGVSVSANYAVASGTECAHASPPAFQIVDFEHVGGQRVILPGATGTSISVQTAPDRVAEGPEHFCVGLSIPEGGEGVLGRRVAVGVIQDDDLAPTVSIGDAQVTEGDAGTVLASFTVTFSNPTELCAASGDFCGASVEWVTVPGTAAAPSDFTQASGRVVMSPPDSNTFAVQLTHRIEVVVAGDTVDEADEHFKVALSTPTNASIPAPGGVGTAVILDDDAPPAVTTSAASDVTPATAMLHAVADTSQKATTVWFEYGPSAAYGLTTAPVTLAASGPVSAAVSGLALGTVYHYRAVAHNATGTAYGSPQTFVTSVPAPQAVTLAASGVGASTASVAGQLTTHGRETGYWFEFGATTAYGSSTPARSLTNPASQQVTEQLTGLRAGTTYHYRLMARRGDSIVQGDDHTFRTAQLVTRQRTLPAVSLLTRSATLTRTIVVAKLRCVRAQGRCRGALTLDVARRSLASAGSGRVVIGRVSFAARPGRTATLAVQLSAQARHALIKARRLGALAVVTFRDDTGAGPARRASMTLLMPAKRRS